MFRKHKPKEMELEPRIESHEQQKTSILWSMFEIKLIVDCFCTENEKRIGINYYTWTNEHQLNDTDKMISWTRLSVRERFKKKKISAQLFDMIKQYKDLKHTIEQSRLSRGLNGLEKISHKDCKFQIRS